MSRDIEFRAWTGTEYVYSNVDGDKYDKAEYLSIFFKNQGFRDLEQYTGLKDKNGKKIFEGDVVLIHNPTTRKKPYECTVYFNKSIAAFEGKTDELTYELFLNDCHVDDGKPELLKIYRTIEIIGNIHEEAVC